MRVVWRARDSTGGIVMPTKFSTWQGLVMVAGCAWWATVNAADLLKPWEVKTLFSALAMAVGAVATVVVIRGLSIGRW